MHALMLLVPASSVDAVCAFLSYDLDALSASVEHADAGTDAEQPVFVEPGDTATATSKRRRGDPPQPAAAASCARAGAGAACGGTGGWRFVPRLGALLRN